MLQNALETSKVWVSSSLPVWVYVATRCSSSTWAPSSTTVLCYSDSERDLPCHLAESRYVKSNQNKNSKFSNSTLWWVVCKVQQLVFLWKVPYQRDCFPFLAVEAAIEALWSYYCTHTRIYIPPHQLNATRLLWFTMEVSSRFSVKKSSSPSKKQDKTNLISDSQDDEINTSNYHYGSVIVQNGSKKSGKAKSISSSQTSWENDNLALF